MELEEMITQVMAQLQHLQIESTYNNMRAICSCLETLQQARAKVRAMTEEAAKNGENKA